MELPVDMRYPIRFSEQSIDYLYGKMRGARGEESIEPSDTTAPDDEALVLLTEIRDSMRKLAESGSTQ